MVTRVKKSPAQLQREIDVVLARPLVQSSYSVHSPGWERDSLVRKLKRGKARLEQGTQGARLSSQSSRQRAKKHAHATVPARLPGAAAKETKKNVTVMKAFNSKVEKLLDQAGATLHHELSPDHRQFVLETKAGSLFVTPLGNWVAARFNDPEAAAKLVGTSGLNTYSGKWNHNYFDWPVNEALSDVASWLNRIAA